MVSRLLKIFYRDFTRVNEAALLLAVFTLLSQILGLIRDRLFATYVGPGMTLDIYYSAFRIPDILFVSIASLVSVTILIPFLVEKRDNSWTDEKDFLSQVFSAFSLGMIVISIIVFFLMPLLAPIVAPGFDEESKKILIDTSRIMLLSPFLLGLSNIFGTITQLSKKFFVLALTPILYNIGIIMGTLVLYPLFGLSGLVYGVLLGALLHMGIQIPVLIRQKMVPRLQKFDISLIIRIITTSFPRTITLSLQKITFVGLSAIATLAGTGAVSLFTFSYNLQAVPLALIGMSFSVAAFPTLVEYYHNRDHAKFTTAFLGPARQIIFWSLPIMVLFIVLRAQIVRVIFGSAVFSWSDTRITAASFALFTVSIVAQSFILLLVKGYYAAGKTYAPLRMHAVGLLVTLGALGSGFLIVKIYPEVIEKVTLILRLQNADNAFMLILPFAFSVGMLITALVMWLDFSKKYLEPGSGTILHKTFFESLFASLVIGATTYIALVCFALVFNLNTFWGVLGQGFFAGMCGLLVGVIILKLIKNEEFYEFQITLQSKFWKEKITDLDIVEQKNISQG